jgi:uncharacterized protein (DUF1800 family)
MKKYFQSALLLGCLIGAAAIFSSFNTPKYIGEKPKFPYKKAGLTKKQAAAHLLSRFTYGAKPGEVEEVKKMGLEKWFKKQLEANLPDDSLNKQLAIYPSLFLDNTQISNTYFRNDQILRRAIKEGVINFDKDSIGKYDYTANKVEFESYMKLRGLKQNGELNNDLINQKIIRAAYSNNQLREIMTSFWYNHFNISNDIGECYHFTTCYEKDVIRPNSLGKFGDLLLATAKSPAMLMYLDNYKSVASDNNLTPEAAAKKLQDMYAQQKLMREKGDTGTQYKDLTKKINGFKYAQGYNENYAREIMELHTLGVDGGYTQADVTNAARVLTGWTFFPMNNDYGLGDMQKMIDKVGVDSLKRQGFVREGDFLFKINKHDKSEKKVLGYTFPAKGGYEEGLRLIDILAHFKSTAHFICKKLAVRFVSDNPPASLVDKMAKTFLEKDGDIKQVLVTMVNSPEFWSKEALREKIKSPFELVISTVRALDAKVTKPMELFYWTKRMGENIYRYLAPTGFPDKGQYWINSGSLLTRMNFGLAFAGQRIPGVSFNQKALNKDEQPKNAEDALKVYCKLLMPEQDIDETVKRLSPLLNDPDLMNKIYASGLTTKTTAPQPTKPENDQMMSDQMMMNEADAKKVVVEKPVVNKKTYDSIALSQANNKNLLMKQVAGIVIGSPEFQRR